MQKSEAITIFEALDEKQIINADKAVKQAMVYETTIQGERTQEITYIGVKHLVLQMSINDNPLEILDGSYCRLEKDDPEDKKTWHWRAYKIFRNQKTKLVSDGRSECPYLEAKDVWKDGKKTGEKTYEYDPFAQRKADSKAERNAQRKQIPEILIKEFLKAVKSEQIQQVKDPVYCECIQGIRDWNYGTGFCKVCGKKIPGETRKGACKCNDSTKNANPKKPDGTCPVCNGVRF